MKKLITILGILLAVTILLSGSAVAAWVYVTVDYSEDCTYIDEIEGAEDDVFASLGEDRLPFDGILGWVFLDLGSGNEMGPSQDFTVFASSSVSEYYDVFVQASDHHSPIFVGNDEDTANHVFTTPSLLGVTYRYIIRIGDSGVRGDGPAWGPDIDAVGWYKP